MKVYETTVISLELPPKGFCSFDLPGGAQPIGVAMRDGVPVMWVRCNVNDQGLAKRTLHFRIARTGDPLDQGVGRHVGTLVVDVSRGEMVIHVFEHDGFDYAMKEPVQ